ncbi:MAG: hypothetical protein COW89_02470, partial [Nitrospinae bacterium CG22_combo_CG10-13_8_21_14_all_47_10]
TTPPRRANRQKPFRADENDGVQDKAGPHPFPVGRGRRGGNMAKRFETTPGGLERTEMPGLLAVRRAPTRIQP